ncbi:hypothetical protein CEXT_513811 [Caerostris extrusa]|uniref:Uncharacterized protein n=1 Tax=Caerostris extrusa TaxID=172846 RepID=A0AAV4UXJ4_CAEEX|nr:hypothetical protein CEXT_513811 [Caerostris extrusa]
MLCRDTERCILARDSRGTDAQSAPTPLTNRTFSAATCSPTPERGRTPATSATADSPKRSISAHTSSYTRKEIRSRVCPEESREVAQRRKALPMLRLREGLLSNISSETTPNIAHPTEAQPVSTLRVQVHSFESSKGTCSERPHRGVPPSLRPLRKGFPQTRTPEGSRAEEAPGDTEEPSSQENAP